MQVSNKLMRVRAVENRTIDGLIVYYVHLHNDHESAVLEVPAVIGSAVSADDVLEVAMSMVLRGKSAA